MLSVIHISNNENPKILKKNIFLETFIAQDSMVLLLIKKVAYKFRILLNMYDTYKSSPKIGLIINLLIRSP